MNTLLVSLGDRFWPPVMRLLAAGRRHTGTRETVVRVCGRYQPDVIRAQRDVPLRITFDRREATPCSDWVVFSRPRHEAYLPPFRRTTIELLPVEGGEHLFTCRMGIYQGRLIVSEGPGVRGRLTSVWRRVSGQRGRDGEQGRVTGG